MMEKEIVFWNKSVATFGMHSIAVKDISKIADIALSTVPMEVKKLSAKPTENIFSSRDDVIKYMEKLKKEKEDKSSVFIVGFLLNKEAELEISDWGADGKTFQIHLTSPEWLKATKSEKEKFNKIWKELERKLKPEKTNFDTEYTEMNGKINENGFIIQILKT